MTGMQTESTLTKTVLALGGLAGGMVLFLLVLALYVILAPDLVAFVK